MSPMKYLKKEKVLHGSEKDSDPFYLRGYCRVCNRHYFYRNQLDTAQTQVQQHHGGICQICRYRCARIK